MYHQMRQITGIANFSLGLNFAILPKVRSLIATKFIPFKVVPSV